MGVLTLLMIFLLHHGEPHAAWCGSPPDPYEPSGSVTTVPCYCTDPTVYLGELYCPRGLYETEDERSESDGE